MTVQELINKLNTIEDKTLPIIVNDHVKFCCDNLYWQEADSIWESKEYFHRDGVEKDWNCVKISGN